MYRFFSVIVLSLLITSQLCGQRDTVTAGIYKWTTPVGLMIGGSVLSGSDMGWHRSIHRRTSRQIAPIDDYIQYLPSAFIAAQLITDKQARVDHGWQYLVSTAATGAITFGMKRIINKRRPNGGYLSFPSGHTSFAFSTSTVLYHMTRERSPVLAYLSYLPAVAVAGYRVVRNKHWVSDVLFGAGLGILVTHLTYHWMPSSSSDRAASSAVSWHLGITDHGVGLVMRW